MRFKTILALGLVIGVAVTCHKRNNPYRGVDDPGDGPQAPLALFSIAPDTVELNQVVYVDASTCSDVEDSSDILRVRWDWNTDGIWDTPYRLAKLDSTSYSTPGLKHITLEVKDTDNMADTLELPVWVNAPNTAPTACFSVSPDTGDETTVFTFNAGCSNDSEDSLSALSFRWDWDSDGTWDTVWVQGAVATHRFVSTGVKTITLQVRDSDGDTASTSSQLNVGGSNTSPTACFNVSPGSGTINTSFQVSAVCSDDAQDPAESLRVRWDWDGDGNWDTGYSTAKTTTHSYTTVGTKTIKMQVMDTEGMYAITQKQVVIENTAPRASFDVTPALGTLDTVFRVDASACSDSEDAAGALEVRFDWEDNGTWDVVWTTTKTHTHTYSTTGGKTIRMEVRDTDGAVTALTRTVNVSSGNTPPVAVFTVDADSGDTSTSFQFDASGCTDGEDAASVLKVRWDWENNGVFDDGWNTVKTASHTYGSAGTYVVKMEVMDSESLVASCFDTLYVSALTVAEPESLLDVRDNRKYAIVTIGSQTWMAENLNYGSRIDGANQQADNDVVERYAYDDLESNADIYGSLYQWHEAMQYSMTEGVQGICPNGWHLPSDDEWKQLEMTLGMSQATADLTGYRGSGVGTKLKVGGDSGFEAMLYGSRYLDGTFRYIGTQPFFWTSTGTDSGYSWGRSVRSTESTVYRHIYEKEYGFCVRCVRGQGATPLINTKPVAVFTLSDDTVDVNTNFSVDASNSYDAEDNPSALKVSWQWSAGGGWSSFTTTKTAGNVYAAVGQYTISMIVQDTEGLIDTASKVVTVVDPVVGTLYDARDGKTYATIKIGTQTWMAENLNYGIRIDGTQRSKNNGVTERYAYADLDEHADTLGALYAWQEAMNYSTTPGVQGICPNGWHIPTDAEWKALEMALGMSQAEADIEGLHGTDEGKKLKVGGSSGFNAQLAGYQRLDGTYRNLGSYVDFWTSSLYSDSMVWRRVLTDAEDRIARTPTDLQGGFCVRCIKGDGVVPSDVFTDVRDGHVYKMATVGSQVWMAENLNYGFMQNSITTAASHSDVSDNDIVEKYALYNDESNCDIYGGFYDWNEMMAYDTTEGIQGICPAGWHLPTVNEWTTLINFVGGDSIAGLELKSGDFGLDIQLTGCRNNIGDFISVDSRTYCWTSTQNSGGTAWHTYINTGAAISFAANHKTYGFCVRCLRD